MAGGRPTKYKKEYCKMLIEHMTEGLSFESFGGVVGVWKEALYNWVKKYPEFSNAKKEGTHKCMLFYEKAGRQGMLGKIAGFNSTTWLFNMKNRFGWRDKKEIDTNLTASEGLTVNIIKSSSDETD